MASTHTTLRQIFDAETVSADKMFVGTDETGYTWRTNSFFVYSGNEGNKPSPLKAVKGTMRPGMSINRMDPSFMCVGGIHNVGRDLVRKLVDRPFFIYGDKLFLLDKQEIAAYDKYDTKKASFHAIEELKLDFSVMREGLLVYEDFLARIPEDVLNRCVFSLGVSASKLIILHIQDDTGMLYKALNQYPEPMYMQIETASATYYPTEWDYQTKHYRKVETTMFKLPELKKVDSSSIEQASNDAVNQLMEELDIPKKDEAPKEEPKKEAPKKAPKKEVEQKPVEEAPVEVKKEEPKEAPKKEAVKEDDDKPKRINKPKKVLRDLKPIIEEISSTVPDDMDVSVVLNEIRQLRDLIKVACCRSSNLSTVYLERATTAVKTLKEVSCLLSQKI